MRTRGFSSKLQVLSPLVLEGPNYGDFGRIRIVLYCSRIHSEFHLTIIKNGYGHSRSSDS